MARRRVTYRVALRAATEAGASEASWSLWALPVAFVAATWWWAIGLPGMKCPSCSADLEPQWSSCVACGHPVRELDAVPDDVEEVSESAVAAQALPEPAIDEAALDQLWDEKS